MPVRHDEYWPICLLLDDRQCHLAGMLTDKKVLRWLLFRYTIKFGFTFDLTKQK